MQFKYEQGSQVVETPPVARETETASSERGTEATGGVQVRPRRHVESLDGLRAVAILAVMAVHSGVPGASMGWLGVDLFFVLSGFLITSLLAEEFQRKQRISLTRFWGRRFLRLMPAYWLYAGGLTVSIAILHWGWLHSHGGWRPGNYIASIWLYFNNYLPQGGIWEYQTLSIHLWSLAVEEQFYLVWPIFFSLVMSRNQTIAFALIWTMGAAVAFRWMAVAWGLRLDQRGIGIVLGCALAVTLHQGRWTWLRRWLNSTTFRTSILVAIAMLVVAGTIAAKKGVEEKDVRHLTLPLFAPLFALLVAMLWYGPKDRISRFLSWSPLVYIGTISYGMYLYHMLCHFLTWDILTPGLEHWPRVPKFALRASLFLALTLAISTLSYRLIERPFLRIKDHLR